jgi:hypothetical protein
VDAERLRIRWRDVGRAVGDQMDHVYSSESTYG